MTGSSLRAERLWLAAAAAVAVAAVVGRLHSAAAFPALQDYDAAGHVQSAHFFLQGLLPPPSSWSGFHPPLYHALAGLAWAMLPESVPVHLAMRYLSLAPGLAAIAIVWRHLARRFAPEDAAVTAVLLLSIPFVGIALVMLGNEGFCALFATLVLVRLLDLPTDDGDLVRHALVTGLWVALAALSKSTGWVVGGVAGLAYLVHARASLPRALLCGTAIALPALLLAAPFYVRVALDGGGSPMSFLSGAAHSPDLALVMSSQPPGQRELWHYLNFPASAIAWPRFDGAGMATSVPGLLHASAWADVHGHYIWITTTTLKVLPIVSVAGLFATVFACFGLLRIVQRRSPGELWALLFAGLLFAALLRYSWVLPTYSAVKASYLLPALLPIGLAFASALQALRGRFRSVARGLLLLLAAGDTAFLWFGWWI